MIFDEIWKLRRAHARVGKDFRKEIQSTNSSNERQSLESQMQFELESLEDDLRVARTRKLLEAARKLDIPVPSGAESWGEHQTSRQGFLKDEVREGLRQQIRKDGKESRELWKDILLISGLAAGTQLIWSLARAVIGYSAKK